MMPNVRTKPPGSQIRFESTKEKLLGRYLPLGAQAGIFGYSVFALSAFVPPLFFVGAYAAVTAVIGLRRKFSDPVKRAVGRSKGAVVVQLGNAKTTVDSVSKKIPHLDRHPDIFEDIRHLAERAGLGAPPVLLFRTAGCDQKQVKAKAFPNQNPERNVLLLNCRILEVLERRELNAVIAHEMTHMQRDRNLRKITDVVDVMAGVQAFLAAQPLGFIGAQLVGAVHKKHAELVADRGSALITGRPEDLISAFKKIEGAGPVANVVVRAIEWAATWIFGAHPPFGHRIKQLEQFKADDLVWKGVPLRHDFTAQAIDSARIHVKNTPAAHDAVKTPKSP